MKRVLALLVIAALVYTLGFLALIHFRGRIDNAREADVIIVLGAGLLRDGSAGPALTRRSQQGAELWTAGLAPYVICAGGRAEDQWRSEAEACREILLGAGVAEAAILIEDRSRSTEENAIYSKEILARRGWSEAALVSDSFHMLRASWLFARLGIATTASPVPASRIRDPFFYPYALVREFLAFHWHFLKDALGLPQTHISGI